MEGKLTGISTTQPRVSQKPSGKATQPGLTKTGLRSRNWKVIQDAALGWGYLAAPSAPGICLFLLTGLSRQGNSAPHSLVSSGVLWLLLLLPTAQLPVELTVRVLQ